MATVINNPAHDTAATETSGAGLVVAIIVGVILLALLFLYGLPALRGTQDSAATPGINANVNVLPSSPAPSTPSTPSAPSNSGSGPTTDTPAPTTNPTPSPAPTPSPSTP